MSRSFERPLFAASPTVVAIDDSHDRSFEMLPARPISDNAVVRSHLRHRRSSTDSENRPDFPFLRASIIVDDVPSSQHEPSAVSASSSRKRNAIVIEDSEPQEIVDDVELPEPPIRRSKRARLADPEDAPVQVRHFTLLSQDDHQYNLSPARVFAQIVSAIAPSRRVPPRRSNSIIDITSGSPVVSSSGHGSLSRSDSSIRAASVHQNRLLTAGDEELARRLQEEEDRAEPAIPQPVLPNIPPIELPGDRDPHDMFRYLNDDEPDEDYADYNPFPAAHEPIATRTRRGGFRGRVRPRVRTRSLPRPEGHLNRIVGGGFGNLIRALMPAYLANRIGLGGMGGRVAESMLILSF
jgi:hypothetical protein